MTDSWQNWQGEVTPGTGGPPPPSGTPLPPPSSAPSSPPPPSSAPLPGPVTPAPPNSSPLPPPSAAPAGAGGEYVCAWCRMTSFGVGVTCPMCGAPVDAAKISNAGWILQPGIRDLARVQFGRSRLQVSGKAVPVCDVLLGEGEEVYFFHESLLWCSGVRLEGVNTQGGWVSRSLGGMSRKIVKASGPGNVALSADHPGDMIAVPLAQGQGIMATEHHMIMISESVVYGPWDTGVYISEDKDNSNGDVVSRFVNVFSAQNGPGLVMLHAPGDVMIKDLAPGQTIFVQPGSLVYFDPSVSMRLWTDKPATSGGMGLGGLTANSMPPRPHWTQVAGPGRVAVSSVYRHIPRLPGASSPDAGPGRSWNTNTGWGGGLNIRLG